MASMKKLRAEQEILEDEPESKSTKPSRSLFAGRPNATSPLRSSSLSKGNPRKNAGSVSIAKPATEGRATAISNNKISALFDTTLSYTKEDINRLVEGGSRPGHASKDGNQNPVIQELKTTLKTVFEELEVLRNKCDEVELRYKEATITASQELQQSMNILFKLQQKTAHFEDSSSTVDKLKDDLKVMKWRLAVKEKERRAFKAELEEKEKKMQEQAIENAEMARLLGGSAEDLAQQALDAQMAQSLFAELNIANDRIKDLRDEVAQLKSAAAAKTEQWAQAETLVQQAQSAKDAVAVLEREKNRLQRDLETKKGEVTNANRELASLRQALTGLQERLSKVLADPVAGQSVAVEMERELRVKAEQREERERVDRISAQARLDAAESEWIKLSEQMQNDLAEARDRYQELKNAKAATDALLEEKEKQLQELQQQQRPAPLSRGASKSKVTSSPEYERRIAELETKLLESQADNRRVQTQLLEVKGGGYNVKIYGRLRKLDGPQSIVASGNVLSVGDKGGKAVFDGVFSSSSTEDLFSSLVDLIQYVVSGHHSSVLCFGERKSGKTTTIMGNRTDSGVLCRALMYIANQTKVLEAEGWTYTLHVSYVEIANENIMDLFGTNADSTKLELQKSSEGDVIITNVTLVAISPSSIAEQLEALLGGAEDIRRKSSRSRGRAAHEIFSVHIRGFHTQKNINTVGKLSFVDLAEAEGLSAGEFVSQEANRSLTCLYDVLCAMSHKQSHVPYRNSKLTYLLQPSLSPQGRAVMVMNMNTGEGSATANSKALYVANQISQINMPSAKSQGAPARPVKKINATLDIRRGASKSAR